MNREGRRVCWMEGAVSCVACECAPPELAACPGRHTNLNPSAMRTTRSLQLPPASRPLGIPERLYLPARMQLPYIHSAPAPSTPPNASVYFCIHRRHETRNAQSLVLIPSTHP